MKGHADQEAAGIDELDHVPQPGSPLTGGTIATILDYLLEGGLLFRLDDEGIARHFAQFFFSGNAWQVDLAALRDVVAKVDGCPDDIPADPAEFGTWVRRDLLDFDHLPRSKLDELHRWASEDLASILANVSHCETRLGELGAVERKNPRSERRSPKLEGENYEVGFYRHFLMKNSEARDEIVEVLAHRSHREALRAAYRPLLPGMFDFHVPWAFRWFPHRYSAERYSQIAHVFLELPIDEFHRVQDLHRQGQWSEFDEALVSYVREHRPVARVKALLDQHHLLAVRRSVLVPALDAYERGELALFASAVAIQIEGVFEDACHLSGVSLNELRIATLVPKLDALLRKSAVRIDYTYYAFKFPVLRNTVAHGRMLDTDLNRTARLLLLDLHDACRVVAGHPGPHNDLVKLLQKITPLTASVLDAVEFAVLYAEAEGTKPDQFYGLSHSFDEMLSVLERRPLWDALEALLAVGREELDSGVRLVASRLMKLHPSQAGSCKHLLGLLADRGDVPFDRREFLSAAHALPTGASLVFSAEEIHAILLGLLARRGQTAEAAYLRWKARGEHHGGDLEDWRAAEGDLFG